MKYTCILLFALLLCGCDYLYNEVEITGTTPGIDTGIVIIKDASGKTVFGANIKNGKYEIRRQALLRKDYYKISFIKDQTKRIMREGYEIYLEPGAYTISTGRKGKSGYPIITSSSKTQNELSEYYPYADSVKKLRSNADELMDRLNSPAAQRLPDKEYAALLAKVKEAQSKEGPEQATILNGFIAKYPQSEVIAHIMVNMDYDRDPVENYKIYQKFSEAAKKTDDGQEIGEKLSHLVKMLPGALAPQLTGETFDDKKLDIPAMHKKIILVEFCWAGLTICRKNHQTMVTGFLPNLPSSFGIISVSLDEKRDWWTTAVTDDKMTWPQVWDGKGSDSPNADNWGLSTVPTYCLIDGTGHVIDRDVTMDGLMFNVNDYLAKHH